MRLNGPVALTLAVLATAAAVTVRRAWDDWFDAYERDTALDDADDAEDTAEFADDGSLDRDDDINRAIRSAIRSQRELNRYARYEERAARKNGLLSLPDRGAR